MNIYVGNLAHEVTEDELRQIFEEYGEVSTATILKDKYTGESRGFGFVEMPGKEDATQAIQKIDGMEVKGRRLIVNEARKREDNRGKRHGGGGRGGSRGGRGGRW
jgi:RNA recognition motif-containing protein